MAMFTHKKLAKQRKEEVEKLHTFLMEGLEGEVTRIKEERLSPTWSLYSYTAKYVEYAKKSFDRFFGEATLVKRIPRVFYKYEDQIPVRYNILCADDEEMTLEVTRTNGHIQTKVLALSTVVKYYRGAMPLEIGQIAFEEKLVD